MSELPHDRKLALAAIQVFADDGALDESELDFLLDVALRDKVIDEGEKRVLAGVFDRVTEGDVTARVWERIRAVRTEYGI